MTEKDSLENSTAQASLVGRLVRVANISHGDMFKMSDGSLMMKIRNPNTRPLQDLSNVDVWAADIGNGKLTMNISPREFVEHLGRAFELRTEIP